MRRMVAIGLAMSFVIAIQAAAPASAQTPSSAPQLMEAERLSLLAMLDEGLAQARARVPESEGLFTLGTRDTLYLYDMVHGNVKMIATSPNGGLIRRIAAQRLLAGAAEPARAPSPRALTARFRPS
jgi:hypothetical protein